MPANLPPEYYEAETRFKQASTPQEKISALEALIATVPKHKGTDKLRADLRRKLSKLREEAAKKKKSGKGDLYTIEKQGAAQAVLVGFANAGKSSVLTALTNAKPVVADFPMSTVMPLSGMMPFEDIQFQLIDLPPLGNESTDGWISGIVRNAAIILLIVDLSEDPEVQVELLLDQLNNWNIPLLSNQNNGKHLIIVANKLDLPEIDKNIVKLREIYAPGYPVNGFSALHKEGVEELRRVIFENSGIIRVYSKEPGKLADLDKPFTVRKGSNVMDLAEIIHKDFVRNLKYVCIWGSAKFEGQRVQKDYVLSDQDIVEYSIK